VRTVLTFGVWDLLHVGHLRLLEHARSLGDRLAVGVPTDAVVIQDKGRPPIVPFEQRVEMLSALKCVDVVCGYPKLEFIPTLARIKPDVLVVGGQWGKATRHLHAEEWCRVMCVELITVPYHDVTSTTEIINRIRGGH